MVPQNFLSAACAVYLLTLGNHVAYENACPEVAAVAQPRHEFNMTSRRWGKEIRGADSNQGFDIIIYGDHTAEMLLGTHNGRVCEECNEAASAFQQEFGKYRTGVFGLAGEQTGHMLWRLEQGVLPLVRQPKVVVLSLGMADLAAAAACSDNDERSILEAAISMTKRLASTVALLREQLPDSRLVLAGLLPRAEHTSPVWAWQTSQELALEWPSRFTAALRLVNHWLECRAAQDDMISYLDCWPGLLRDGQMVPENHVDAVRLSGRGAGVWTRCLSQAVRHLVPAAGEAAPPPPRPVARGGLSGRRWSIFNIG